MPIFIPTGPIYSIITDGYDNFAEVTADGYVKVSSTIFDPLPSGNNILGKIGIDPLNTGGLALETTLLSIDGKDFATQTTLYDSYNKLISLNNKDFATETTLASLESKDFATQSTLYDSYNKLISINNKDFATEATLHDAYEIVTSIKDTDGIKRINDPLPIGDNIIGRTKITDGTDIFEISSGGQGRVVLYDDVNNLPLAHPTGGVITNRRGILTMARLVKDTGPDSYGYFLHVKNDVDVSSQKRLLVEADIKPGASISVTTQTASAESISVFLENATYQENMVVNGSSTPVSYRYNAVVGHNVILSSLRLVISANSFNFNGASFGKGGGALTNGVNINIVTNDGTVNKTLSTLRLNEDFWRLLDFNVDRSGTSVMAASAQFGSGLKLIAGSSDYVEVIINDDITSGSRDIFYFTATLYGALEGI